MKGRGWLVWVLAVGIVALIWALVGLVWLSRNSPPAAAPMATTSPTTEVTLTVRPTRTPTLLPSNMCPQNCAGAVAAGLTAQQAAACGLDGDGDGVACYGD